MIEFFLFQARIVHVSVNDRIISPAEGFLVRKGPGNCHFDFAQEISFTPSSSGQTVQGWGLLRSDEAQLSYFSFCSNEV